MVSFEICFSDLTEDAQKRLLEEFQTTESEENWDVIPLAYVEREIYGEAGIDKAKMGEHPCFGCPDEDSDGDVCENQDICKAWEIYENWNAGAAVNSIS